MIPIGDKLCVKPDPLESKSRGGIWIDCDKSRGTGQNTLTLGTVKAVGPRCKYGLQPGDRVAYREFMGWDDSGLCFVYEKDILMVIE